MKYLFLFTLLVHTSLALTQGDKNCKTDTSYHINGNIAYIIELNTNFHNCGLYQEFDTSGIVRIEGFYQLTDSVECLNCYTGTPQFQDIKGNWKKYSYANLQYVEIGIWKYYHPNGQLRMIGSYSGKVHSYKGSSGPFQQEMMDGIPISKPIPVYISFDPLKTGQWQYYDEQGNNHLTEEYIDGILVYKTERN
jgi:hypothetical protein